MTEKKPDDATYVAEFTIEPFEEGRPGPHVGAALDAVKAAGLEVDMGPFGSSTQGTAAQVAGAVEAAMKASLDAGATRFSVTISRRVSEDDSEPLHPVFDALRPVLEAVGAEPVTPSQISRLDVPVEWEGEVIGGVRLHSLEGAVSRMVTQITAELGKDLKDLSREEKQQVVSALSRRGAFALRGAVEEVADLMGVSRITIYNYLNALRA